jgi:hypothetical protein
MNYLKNTVSFLAITALIFITSCKKEDDKKDVTIPPIINPEEQITTVILKGYDENNPNDISRQFAIKWEDMDGTGGNAPIIDSLVLDTGTQYRVQVLLLDKTKTPWDTISNEVEKEKNVHQFFYTPSVSVNGKMEVEVLDFDDNIPKLPVGLAFLMNIAAEPTFAIPLVGKLGVVLSHYDGIPKTITPSPESDIDIVFPVKLK